MALRLLSLFTTLLLFTTQLSAQVYEPGWLVRSSGDTLRGEIENGFWVQAPTFIRYRRSADSPSELFLARQVQAVSLTNGRYFRHEVLLLDDAAETRLQQLQQGEFQAIRPDSVLAEVLLTGPIELLRVVRPGATHYELRRPGQPPLSLSERKYLKETNLGAWAIADGNNYRNQLTMYFLDCQAARSKIEKAAFTPADLVAVAQAYATSCTPSQQPARSWLTQSAPKRRVSYQAGLLAGMRFNHLESPVYELAGQRINGVHPFGGLYAEAMQPSRIVAVYGELSVSPFRSKSAQYLSYDAATGNDLYNYFDYRAWLATARIGLRFFAPLPHDQHLVFTFSFEKNKVFAPTVTASTAPLATPAASTLYYAEPTVLPNVGVGWRNQRLTVSLDAQLYTSSDNDGMSGLFFGTNLAARLGVGYRLGHSTDKSTRPISPQP